MSLQKIIGFHQDLEQHWVADFDCGHAQHMRHQPPWLDRAWTQTAEGRTAYLGTKLECQRCNIRGAYFQRDMRDDVDVTLLVRNFYEKVMRDPIIGFYFTDIAKIDVLKHLVKIEHFWNKMLFDIGDYRGRPFDVHRVLDKKAHLSPEHFNHWLFIFKQTVEENFVGHVSTKAVRLAEGIAAAMSRALTVEPMPSMMAESGQAVSSATALYWPS